MGMPDWGGEKIKELESHAMAGSSTCKTVRAKEGMLEGDGLPDLEIFSEWNELNNKKIGKLYSLMA